MIYTVTLNPALDKTVTVPSLTVGQVNRIRSIREDVGGKGINVSKCISVLGGESTALALLAGQTGKKVLAFLEQADHIIPMEAWVPQGETRTNLKIIDPELRCNTDINEPGPAVSGDVLDAIAQQLLSAVKFGDIVVFSGSLPAGAPATLYRDWGIRCRERGVRVILDADRDPLKYGLECHPFLIKPNRDELSALLGLPLATMAELIDAGRLLVQQYAECAVISLGGDGALFFSQTDPFCISAPKVEVKSTVGAGDSMVAALAYGASTGLPWQEQAKLAVACGCAAVTCSGSQSPDHECIQALLQQIRIATI